jgi:hypothetical protein
MPVLRAWGGPNVPENIRLLCSDCNYLRGQSGHCLGALACVRSVAKSIGIQPIHILNRWKLPKPRAQGGLWLRVQRAAHLWDGSADAR